MRTHRIIGLLLSAATLLSVSGLAAAQTALGTQLISVANEAILVLSS